METNQKTTEPDSTAIRTALWRALHLQVDSKPYILEDEVGLKLAAPDEGWQQRPDMHPEFTKRLRASILARARFIEDLIIEQSKKSITQYVILGAGLDTFAQRRPDIAAKLQVFEIDQPDTQIWKQKRLIETGYGLPEWLHFVSVDFEISSWWEQLLNAGFDVNKPAVVVCTGVSLYLTKDAIISTLSQLTALAPGSTLAMTFYLPIKLLDEEDKPLQLIAEKGAKEAGTPFISFFNADEILAMAKEAGFKHIKTVSTKDLERSYFSNRTDNFTPASGEVFLLAHT
ncbi:class I SAM-dependent methyltransferase [Pedobacter montanisoli]|uniref:S-adenosyl-L-methionine-dependent methyltransferase n=1 Tax=Pedobacter montanisoli TaxID=2923277 RepID=A0ABS9ZW65_9SPHI|nr:class I SAM-dependent methyltransferase [Pedobacter montanisoli]MCJ0742547.1 class I SAM-dependent methyltransferase [Pedobacter montanisoli]